MNCQARIFGEERLRDFAYCNLWRYEWCRRHCTSPRRNQCRMGSARPGRNDGWYWRTAACTEKT